MSRFLKQTLTLVMGILLIFPATGGVSACACDVDVPSCCVDEVATAELSGCCEEAVRPDPNDATIPSVGNAESVPTRGCECPAHALNFGSCTSLTRSCCSAPGVPPFAIADASFVLRSPERSETTPQSFGWIDHISGGAAFRQFLTLASPQHEVRPPGPPPYLEFSTFLL